MCLIFITVRKLTWKPSKVGQFTSFPLWGFSRYINVNYSAWHVYTDFFFYSSVATYRHACSENSLSINEKKKGQREVRKMVGHRRNWRESFSSAPCFVLFLPMTSARYIRTFSKRWHVCMSGCFFWVLPSTCHRRKCFRVSVHQLHWWWSISAPGQLPTYPSPKPT